MTFFLPKGPSDGIAVIGGALEHLLPLTNSMNVSARGGAVSAPEASQPIQIFSISLNEIYDESSIISAEPTGWRYMVVKDVPIAIADIRISDEGKSKFARYALGLLARRMGMAADYAAKKHGNDSANYELRIIEVPSLYSVALWLHGDKDIFIPFLEGNSVDVDNEPPIEDPSYLTRIVEAARAKQPSPPASASP